MKNLLYLLCFMLSVQTMSAQGWYRYYDNLPQGELFSGLQVPNGDYVVAGAETVNGSLFLAKMDVDGRVIELRNNYNILINDISQLKRSPEGNLVLLGATRSSFQDISVLVFDGDLNLSAEIVLPSLGFIEKPSVFVFDEEGNIIISAFVQKDMRVQPILAKLDMDGNILWHIPTNEQMGHISDMELNAQGDITLVGKALNDDKAFVSVFDALTGAELAYKLIGNNPLEEEEALDIMSKNDDGAYLLTRFNVLDAATGNIISSHLRMRNLDSNLEVINSYDLSRDIRLEEFVGMHLLDDGTFSYCFLSSEEYERFYIQVVHLDADMQTELWSRSYPDISPEIEYARDFVLTNDGGYLLPGSIANGSSMPLLLRLDAAGTAFTNVISGNVYHDKIKNCQIDPVESVLPSWLVEIQGAGETYYRMSDADGSYSIAVDEGTFDVRVIPQSDAWLPCPPTAVQFNGFYQSTSVDAGVQSLFDCPVMTADISIGSLRRCYERYYDVEYCNIGTEAATGVYIEVEIDSQLLVGNTSIPIDSQNGNLLSFNIGNLGVNQCGTFQVGVNTPCSVPLGDIHCSTVHIYPDTICMDATDWSGAKIKVVGECGDNNQVNFEIRNIGSANMDQPRSFTVIEDEVVFITGKFSLIAC